MDRAPVNQPHAPSSQQQLTASGVTSSTGGVETPQLHVGTAAGSDGSLQGVGAPLPAIGAPHVGVLEGQGEQGLQAVDVDEPWAEEEGGDSDEEQFRDDQFSDELVEDAHLSDEYWEEEEEDGEEEEEEEEGEEEGEGEGEEGLEEESEGSLGGWWPGEEELNPDEDFLLEERPQAYNEAEVLLRRPDTSSSSSGQGGAGTSSSAGAQQQPQQQQGGQAAAAPSLPPHLGLEMLAQRLAAARVAPAGPASAAPSANVWDAGRIATFSGPPAAVRRSDHWLDGQSTLQNGMPLLHWQQARESGTCSVRQGLAVFHHRTHQGHFQTADSLALLPPAHPDTIDLVAGGVRRLHILRISKNQIEQQLAPHPSQQVPACPPSWAGSPAQPGQGQQPPSHPQQQQEAPSGQQQAAHAHGGGDQAGGVPGAPDRSPWPQRQPLVLAEARLPVDFYTVAASQCGRWIAACGEAGLVSLFVCIRPKTGAEHNTQLLEFTHLAAGDRLRAHDMANSVRFTTFGGKQRLILGSQQFQIVFFNLPDLPPGLEEAGEGAEQMLRSTVKPEQLMALDLLPPAPPQTMPQSSPMSSSPTAAAPPAAAGAPAAPAAGTGGTVSAAQPQAPGAAAGAAGAATATPTGGPGAGQQAAGGSSTSPLTRQSVVLLHGSQLMRNVTMAHTTALRLYSVPVNSVVPSPDGRWLAVSVDAPVITLVNTSALSAPPLQIALPQGPPGKRLLVGPHAMVNLIGSRALSQGCQYTSFSPDGRYLAATSDAYQATFVFDLAAAVAPVTKSAWVAQCREYKGDTRPKTEAEARFDFSAVLVMHHSRPVLSLAWAPWAPALLMVGEYKQRLVMMDVSGLPPGRAACAQLSKSMCCNASYAPLQVVNLPRTLRHTYLAPLPSSYIMPPPGLWDPGLAQGQADHLVVRDTGHAPQILGIAADPSGVILVATDVALYALKAATPWSKDLHALGEASGLPAAFTAAAKTVVRGTHTRQRKASSSSPTSDQVACNGCASDSTAPHSSPPATTSEQRAPSHADEPTPAASISAASEQGQGAAHAEEPPTPVCLLSTLPSELVESILSLAASPPWAWSPLLVTGALQGSSNQQQGCDTAPKRVQDVSPTSQLWAQPGIIGVAGFELPAHNDGRVQLLPYPSHLPVPEVQLPEPFPDPAE